MTTEEDDEEREETKGEVVGDGGRERHELHGRPATRPPRRPTLATLRNCEAAATERAGDLSETTAARGTSSKPTGSGRASVDKCGANARSKTAVAPPGPPLPGPICDESPPGFGARSGRHEPPDLPMSATRPRRGGRQASTSAAPLRWARRAERGTSPAAFRGKRPRPRWAPRPRGPARAREAEGAGHRCVLLPPPPTLSVYCLSLALRGSLQDLPGSR